MENLGAKSSLGWEKACSELPLVWVPVLVGIACVALFVTRQRTISEPLLDLRIFTFREYRVSIVAQCLLYDCFMGMTLIIPLTVIEAGGRNAFEAGLVLFPGALAALVFAPDRSIPRDGGDGLSHRVLPTIGRVYGLPRRARVLGAPCARPPSRGS